MNFANLKAISIPEGNVKSIAIGGKTVWKKAEEVQLVTCTVEDHMAWGASYSGDISFVPGMTWGEFCSSEYNTCGLTCNANYVNDSTGCYIYTYIDGVTSVPNANTAIIEGKAYYWDML
jgi:hypothetical protein